MAFGVVPLRHGEGVVGELQIHPQQIVVQLEDIFTEDASWKEVLKHNLDTDTAWSGIYLWINTKKCIVAVKFDPEMHRINCSYLQQELDDALSRLESFICY
jgi:hypothetical protein